MKTRELPGLMLWRTAPDDVIDGARACIASVIAEHRAEFVNAFYDAFLNHPEGAAFLSHSVVQERLSHSMADWLTQLGGTDLRDADAIAEFSDRQARIGAIHARLKAPNHLVLQGATLLKSHIGRRIAEKLRDVDALAATLILLGELIDHAMGVMSAAYVSDAQQRVRTDEAFRQFALGQDIHLERETQRASLMEWSQSVLFDLLGSQDRSDFRALSASTFGMWVRHRAAILFYESPVLASIEALIVRIDQDVLPTLVSTHPRSVQLLGVLQERIAEITFLLGELFQAAAKIEDGRDPLTRTLNRRFLPSLLGREIALAKANDTPLTVALLDIDHFKQVNDRFGHATGDIVLRHVAEILLDCVRASDFVFRYGGEEFLLAFPETNADEASIITTRIRDRFAANPIPMNDRDPLSLTVSIGVAPFGGHPDYEYLINTADKALYRAKQEGRNRVIVAHAA